MGFKKKVLGELEKVVDLLVAEKRAVDLLEGEVKRLREENRELFDRLMARDWDGFVLKQQMGLVGKEMEPWQEELPEDADEANAGEVLSIEE